MHESYNEAKRNNKKEVKEKNKKNGGYNFSLVAFFESGRKVHNGRAFWR